MSAFLLQRPHIDALVQQLIHEKIITNHMATEIGQQLIFENIKSLHYRYGDLMPSDPSQVDYEFQPSATPLDIRCIYIAIKSWTYQTCESPFAEQEPGWKLLMELVEVLENDFVEMDIQTNNKKYFSETLCLTSWDITNINNITEGTFPWPTSTH